MEISASKPVPDDIKKKKKTKKKQFQKTHWHETIWHKSFNYSRLYFYFFYDIESSIIWTLKWKQMVRKYWYCTETFLGKWKKGKKTDKNYNAFPYFHQMCLLLLPLLPPLPHMPPLRQQDQPFLFLIFFNLPNVKTSRMETFIMIHFQLMNSK